MIQPHSHQFHIPVMGIGFTLDSPVKVAHLGIDSVISIVDDIVIEQMREYYCKENDLEYHPIDKKQDDYRALRIAAYLNLVQKLVDNNFNTLKSESFGTNGNLDKYFRLLPDSSLFKRSYHEMLGAEDAIKREELADELLDAMICGAIDVNIMTKVDTVNYDTKGNELPAIYNDAMASLRGYANSDLNSSLVLSAGLNMRLFSYMEEFSDFFPDQSGEVKKKVVLKVSDYRSALVQGKILAKKGILVSEFRIESGLNCGGHAFASEGLLMGPILEEFKEKREDLSIELFELANAALKSKDLPYFSDRPDLKITAQGGVGTYAESRFLLEYYQLDAVGWGSPFLLVPEATNVDEDTLKLLSNAKKEDYYLSDASPLGVPFNNIRNTSNQNLLQERIVKNRPGSPCLKKFLTFNNEFTEKNICTASRQYQDLKLKELEKTAKTQEEYDLKSAKILEKECLCEGLAVSAPLVNNAAKPKQIKGVSVCPGPNLAYFSNTFSLEEMINHIYGKVSVLNQLNRENMFINELELYVNYLKNEIKKQAEEITTKQVKYFERFKKSLLEGVDYYKALFAEKLNETEQEKDKALKALKNWEQDLIKLILPSLEPVTV